MSYLLYGKINPAEQFDEIKLFQYGYNEQKYSNDIALVKANKKWGIYNINAHSMITEPIYDSIEIHAKWDQILILKKGTKIGLYEIEDERDKEISTVVPAEYDDFLRPETVRSADFKYNSFRLFLFSKNGKVCPVGINGVKFYAE